MSRHADRQALAKEFGATDLLLNGAMKRLKKSSN
ncbi:hypothetical protein S101258_00314 [Lactiplantibacillus plantarum subsp. plantarum]|uniref:Uncharacterized protein n=1 Tax=Lactiplantibacillus plantarum subsp. plantarum TaxID=337330 RepID=A0A2S3UA88_LACPN|nr:hypothetical protein S101258_00314 [Lactiplantibacillus plantarum subsp. plantarum]